MVTTQMFEACWISDYSADFPAEGTAVAESVTLTVSDGLDPAWETSVYNEFVDTGNNPWLTSQGQLGSERFPV